jgi:glycosyltransferase involved in cell wall biosynthesis
VEPRRRTGPTSRPDLADVSVSVVIPCYQAATTIAEQITALAAQTWTGPLEVVLADNGSDDDGPLQASAIAAEFGLRLGVVDASEQRGVSHARNVGVAASVGDVVLICDADDVVTRTWVERMVVALQDADVVGGLCVYAGINPPDLIEREGRGPSKGVHVAMNYLPYAVGANFGAWRDVILDVGGWRTQYAGGGDDIDFSWRAQLAGFRLSAATDAVVQYRLREGLGAGMRQRVRKGEMGVLLYSEYRDKLTATNNKRGLRSLGWLLVNSPGLADPRRRHRWWLTAAALWGRIKGSIRYRTIYI